MFAKLCTVQCADAFGPGQQTDTPREKLWKWKIKEKKLLSLVVFEPGPFYINLLCLIIIFWFKSEKRLQITIFDQYLNHNYDWKTGRKNRFLTKIWISYFGLKSESHFFGLKIQFFGCYRENKHQIEECYTSLSSLLNFQSIGIQSRKFFIFRIFCKNCLQKCENWSKNKFSLNWLGSLAYKASCSKQSVF